MLTAMLSAFHVASAYDFEADGIYYNITSMSNLEVEVTHEYASDYVVYNHSYNGDVVIPSTVNYNNRTFTVSSIGISAFGQSGGAHADITGVQLPATIRAIDSNAFRECSSLTSIHLPNSLETIGDFAFSGTHLERIVIPDNVSSIGSYCFNDCSSLKSVVLGSAVETVGSAVFEDCSNMLELFCLSAKKPSKLSKSSVRSVCEIYVPSVAEYGFGIEYLSIASDTFVYNGQLHTIEWTNNLGAYNCEVPAADCVTEMNAGEYTAILHATYSNGVDFTVNIPVNYTVTKAPLTLVVDDMQREYGEPNPTFTCLISGFVNGESEQSLGISPTLQCEATTTSNVGDYRILATFEAANYQVTYTYGNLEIVKAPLTVTVENIARLYGAQNPQFSLVYAGLKNQETEPVWSTKPTVVTTATQASSVGEYEITANNGVAVNYYIRNIQ